MDQSKTITTLQDALRLSRNLIKELKAEAAELRAEIRTIRERGACPLLVELKSEIEQLKKRIQDMQNYERNSLVEGKSNAGN